ncbi:MAG: hypothetical protein VKJ66_01510 [Synechococcus sp.]|nr:hypothetical protein [Synechococcus sp.]
MTETQEHLYAAVELAYSEGQWQQALELGEQLLRQIGDDNPSLHLRLELLLGHTQLYGFGNAAAAAQHYTTVQQLQPEPILLDIAVQGLEHCRQLLGASTAQETPAPEADAAPQEPATAAQEEEPPAPVAATDPFSAAAAATAAPSAGAAAAAMPWMVDLGGQDPSAPAPETLEALATNPFLQAAPAGAVPAASFPPTAPVAAPTAEAIPVAEAPVAVEPSAALALREPEPPEAVVEPAAPEEPLAVDVVDEPELIEVRQADPSTAESIEVVPLEETPSPEPPAAAIEPLFSPEEEDFLARGLLRVVLS